MRRLFQPCVLFIAGLSCAMLLALVEMIWVTHFLLFPPPSAVLPTVQRRRGEGSISGIRVSPPSYLGAGGFRNHQKNWIFVALFTEQNSCSCMNFSYPERRAGLVSFMIVFGGPNDGPFFPVVVWDPDGLDSCDLDSSSPPEIPPPPNATEEEESRRGTGIKVRKKVFSIPEGRRRRRRQTFMLKYVSYKKELCLL